MPVQIGAKAHSFSEPTRLLSDCHRRIEMFLGSLQQVSQLIDNRLADDARAALNSALRYFREAAPKHTADEEESLFPRLRSTGRPELNAVLTKMDSLESDHVRADQDHAEIDRLGQEWLAAGSLSAAGASRVFALPRPPPAPCLAPSPRR